MRYRAIPEFYDAEYNHQDMLQQDVPFFLDHLPPKQSVLELAVGTARAAIPIAQAGHRVLGIDNDQRMLDLAHKKSQIAGLTDRQLRLLHADILTLNLDQKFDWVTILFNTFLVFTSPDEQDQALQAVRRHLKPRGRFWLDIFQPNLPILAHERSVGLEPTLFYEPFKGRTVFKTTEIRPRPAEQIQRVIFHYVWFDTAGHSHTAKTAFDLTFLFPRELTMLLERNGFQLDHLYGNYDGSPLNDDSPRMIACCRMR